jgi:hypothetical protein
MTDKLSYLNVSESLGKDIFDRAMGESTVSALMHAGEHQQLLTGLNEFGVSAFDFGGNMKETEMTATQATIEAWNMVTGDGLFNSNLEVATAEKAGQDYAFAAHHKNVEALAAISGTSVGETYVRAEGHISQAISGADATRLLEIAERSEGEYNSILWVEDQLDAVIAGEANQISMPTTDGMANTSWLVMDNLGLNDVTKGGFEGADFFAPMTPERASELKELMNSEKARFGEDYKAQLETIRANDGGVMNFNMAPESGLNNIVAARVQTEAGNAINENSEHKIADGFDINSQAIFDSIISPKSTEDAIRVLNLATETSSALKDTARELTHQLYAELEQLDSNDLTSVNSLSAKLFAELSAKTVADALPEIGGGSGNNNEVPKIDPGSVDAPDSTSKPSSGSKNSGASNGIKMPRLPVNFGVAGDASTSVSWSQHEIAQMKNNVNEQFMAQQLQAYQHNPDKEVALETLQDAIWAKLVEDRAAAYDASLEDKPDEYDISANGEESAIEWGASIADDVIDGVKNAPSMLLGTDAPDKERKR